LVEAGGTEDEIQNVKSQIGLGLFLRSLVGLDREAAKKAFATFLANKTLTANQIQFVDLIIESLAQRGWIDPQLLYDSPFSDFSSRGVEGVFNPEQVNQIIAVLDGAPARAAIAA
jgi:type I restriction enzyme R subunit